MDATGNYGCLWIARGTSNWVPLFAGVMRQPKEVPVPQHPALPHRLTIEQLAEHLSVTPHHVRRLVAERRVPYVRWRTFDPSEISAWLDGARQPEAPSPRPAVAASPEPLRLFDSDRLEPSSHVETGSKLSAEESLHRVAEAARLVAKARAGFVRAVTTARGAGCNWRRIGTAAGLPCQSLQRRSRGSSVLALRRAAVREHKRSNG
jgi:hypothetical protein